MASSTIFVGWFWLWEAAKRVIDRNFQRGTGTKAVQSSGHHRNFVVKAFHDPGGIVTPFQWSRHAALVQKMWAGQPRTYLTKYIEDSEHIDGATASYF